MVRVTEEVRLPHRDSVFERPPLARSCPLQLTHILLKRRNPPSSHPLTGAFIEKFFLVYIIVVPGPIDDQPFKVLKR